MQLRATVSLAGAGKARVRPKFGSLIGRCLINCPGNHFANGDDVAYWVSVSLTYPVLRHNLDGPRSDRLNGYPICGWVGGPVSGGWWARVWVRVRVRALMRARGRVRGRGSVAGAAVSAGVGALVVDAGAGLGGWAGVGGQVFWLLLDGAIARRAPLASPARHSAPSCLLLFVFGSGLSWACIFAAEREQHGGPIEIAAPWTAHAGVCSVSGLGGRVIGRYGSGRIAGTSGWHSGGCRVPHGQVGCVVLSYRFEGVRVIAPLAWGQRCSCGSGRMELFNYMSAIDSKLGEGVRGGAVQLDLRRVGKQAPST
jgi:hypothetical protein